MRKIGLQKLFQDDQRGRKTKKVLVAKNFDCLEAEGGKQIQNSQAMSSGFWIF
jgi:hypothetical protein